MSGSVPYIGFSNETLKALPQVVAGDAITCPKCLEQHVLEGDNDVGLLFFKCGGVDHVGAVNWRCVVGVPADVKGRMPGSAS